MDKNNKRRKWGRQWKVYKNQDIKAFKIQVVNDEWENLWLMTRSKALATAEENWLDLVQISYDANTKICTAKMLDYWKYQYDKKKAENEKKKSQKNKWQKEIKIWYNIGDQDLIMKVNKWIDFLAKWYTLRVVVKLRWREKVYANIARTKIDFVESQLFDHAKSQWLKKEGFGFSVLFFPLKK